MNLKFSLSLFQVFFKSTPAKMTTQSWYGSDAFKSACDIITSHANKFKPTKSGYNKMRPKILPKGLSTFRSENYNDYDDSDDCDEFLKARPRIHSVGVIDNEMRKKLNEKFNKNDEFIYSIGAVDLNGLSLDFVFKVSI